MIKDLAIGAAQFNAMVTSADLKQTKGGENYALLEIRDRSASIRAMVWQWDTRGWEMPKPGNLIGVDGLIEDYKGAKQCKVGSFSYLAPQQVNMADFMPTAARPAEEMHAELVLKVQARIKSVPLGGMLLDMITDAKIKEALLISPAAKRNHDAQRGGLLSHILDLWSVSEGVLAYYGDALNSDLILAYCVLHDIGKLKEISPEPGFAYTILGDLAGHIIIGAHLVFGYCRKHKLPEDLMVRVAHGVAAHHGSFGDIKPQTMEVAVFHFIDNLCATVSAVRQAFSEDSAGAARVRIPMLNQDFYR